MLYSPVLYCALLYCTRLDYIYIILYLYLGKAFDKSKVYVTGRIRACRKMSRV